MTTFHAVVWMDHTQAHVLMFDREHVEAQRIKASAPTMVAVRTSTPSLTSSWWAEPLMRSGSAGSMRGPASTSVTLRLSVVRFLKP